MFALQKIAQAAPRVCRLAGAQRGMAVVSGPPMVRISFPEKVAHGLLISVCVSALPLWVLHHLEEYKGNTGVEEE